MTTVARSLLALLCAGLAGCVMRPYTDADGQDIAEIIFHNEGAGVGTAEIFEQAGTCQRRRVTAPVRPGGAVSARVPAGGALSFALGYKTADGKQCRVYATFTPARQAGYEAFIRPGQGGCELALRRQPGIEGGESGSVKFRTRTPAARPLTEYSAFCR